MVTGIAVGRATVGNGMGVSDGNGFVSPEVAVTVGGNVCVGKGVGVPVGLKTAVSVGTQVTLGKGVAVSVANRLLVGVRVFSGASTRAVLVGRSASAGGSTINTPTSSMAVPAFSNVILTKRAFMGGNRIWRVSACETVPLKPACSEWKT